MKPKIDQIPEVQPKKEPGISIVRAMAIISIMCACVIALLGVALKEDLVGLAALCSAFITPAFAAKVVQKHFETRGEYTK